LFNYKNVKLLLEKHFSGKEDLDTDFALIILELWFRIFVDKEKIL
jgi:vacuolar-type H+-ATPase subunit C/Vma6